MNDYGALVVPIGNADEAFHRWFRFKEAFSSRLLQQLVKEDGLDTTGRPTKVLDCFAGGGTTLVSAGDLASATTLQVHATGFEANPFLHLVTKTKSAAMLGGNALAIELQGLVPRIIRRCNRALATGKQIEPPALATFRNPKYFSARDLRKLLLIREAVKAEATGVARDVLLLAAASVVEQCSRLRKDGRALRFEPSKQPLDPFAAFEAQAANYISDVQMCALDNKSFSFEAKLGDSRELLRRSRAVHDLIVFSPPYPNNIDYTEVYKMEAWYLGLYGNARDMSAQRLATIRSHPSVRFPDSYSFESIAAAEQIIQIIGPVLGSVPQDRYTSGRIQVIKGWVDDMVQILAGARKRVDPNGRLTFIVGNSSHGAGDQQFVIASDVLMSAVAELLGWRVDEVRIARMTKRRLPSLYLRESVVVLRPDSEAST